MPIVKLPVVQRFGIISTKYQLDLQKRFLEKNEQPVKKSPRRPLEISEEFIEQFNNAEDSDEQERMLDLAQKILHKCKRTSGLNSKGSGNHVNLHLAWTELILLARCKGKIQEEALDILFVSMDNANIEQEHVHLLFFMAETVVYRICSDSSQMPKLYSSDIKLLKLGYLTFLRLFICHIFGQLEPFEDHKGRLSEYLEALPACETTYQSYPNILLSVHVMLQIGKTICSCNGPLEHSDSFQTNPFSSAVSNWEINPFVWHCLLIWIHAQMDSPHLYDVIQHLPLYKEGLRQENWLHSLLAVFVLGEAAKLNIFCLRALMELGKDFVTFPQHQTQIQNSSSNISSFFPWTWEVAHIYIMLLSDICLHGTTSEIQKHAFIGFKNENQATRECNGASLHELLHLNSLQTSDISGNILWIIRYVAVYNLVKVCHELRGDVKREGLRNAVWKALYNQISNENDIRILDAVKVAEAEVNGPENPFISTNAKASSSAVCLAFSQHVGFKLASALSRRFLPIEPYIPLPKKTVQSKVPIKLPEIKQHSKEKKVSHLSLRQEDLNEEAPFKQPAQYITRTNIDLQKVVKDQWEKELHIRMKEDEETLKAELHEKQKKEEEHFKEIMKKREQKLKKNSKPYEIPIAKNIC